MLKTETQTRCPPLLPAPAPRTPHPHHHPASVILQADGETRVGNTKEKSEERRIQKGK